MNLKEEQKIYYLANLIAVSRIDGSVSPNETQAIDTAMKRIGAKMADLKKADAIVQSEGYVPTAVGSFSTRVANLEDMMLVSFADGTLDQAEKPVILAFAKMVGVTNEQLQLILSEIKAILTSSKATRACPKCSASVSCESKFCPQCGGSLEISDKAAAVAVEYTIPSIGVAIEFAESTASGFIDAVRKAKAAPQNAECVKGKKTWYMAAWPKEQISEAAKLVENLKGMRNRKVWVDGKESPWDEVFGFVWCSTHRNSAYRPLEYCFGVADKRLNLWGCLHVSMEWTKWSNWFSYGIFKKVGLLKSGHIFVFDKKENPTRTGDQPFPISILPPLKFQTY